MHRSERSRARLRAVLALLLPALLGLIGLRDAAAQDIVCAVVKIEIRQELTLERQAFEAKMRITNGLDTLALERVNIEVHFEDEAGNPVHASSNPNDLNARFFIRLDTMSGVDNVSGTGRIAPKGVAEITWLIIPARGSAGTSVNGALYGVGATLSYTFGGAPETVRVAPDVIRVKPMPELTLDYFLPRDVYGDDPLTAEEEAVEPFDLGVRITNSGVGRAQAVKIESAQPRIIENRQGLLVNFELLGTSVGDQPVQNTLLANFGNIEPGRAKVARWVMTSSLSGRFISFEADYVHSNELGGQLTSLLTGVTTHELVRSVRVDLPGRDTVRDFLARKADGYRVYESDGGDAAVLDLSASASVALIGSGNGESRFRLGVPPQSGLVFVRIADPLGAEAGGVSAWRSDGKRLDAANVWRFREVDDNGNDRRYVGLFDTSSTGQYEIRLGGEVVANQPPQIAPGGPFDAVAGQAFAFDVLATDPDGDPIQLSATALPSGAMFVDQGDGRGRLSWTPSVDQLGSHLAVIRALAAGQVTSAQFHIVVAQAPTRDSDGDGMDDDWEIEHFGDLSRDGTGDFDEDGVTDLDEFRFGGNPTLEDRPGRPTLLSPVSGAATGELSPAFLLANASRATDASVDYRFELFATSALTAPVAAADIAEQALETLWDPQQVLEAGRTYHWRAGAHDGASPGDWAYGQFVAGAAIAASDHCSLDWPLDGDRVDAQRPRLGVRRVPAQPGEAAAIRIEVLAADQDDVLRSLDLAPADAEAFSWRVHPELPAGPYRWRATLLGAAPTTCGTAAFDIEPANRAPHGYELTAPQPGQRIDGMLTVRAAGAVDAEDDPIHFEFELDRIATFDSADAIRSGAVPAAGGQASWNVPVLPPGERIHVRVRATDGGAVGPWRYADAWTAVPLAAPVMRAPRDGTWVPTLRPRLEVAPIEHPRAAALRYRYEVYTDAALTQVLTTAVAGSSWPVDRALSDRRWVWWRARAELGGESGPWTAPARLFVIDDRVDDAPTFHWLGMNQERIERPGEIVLRWIADDVDSDARIDLHLDTAPAGEGGVQIVGGLSEDRDDSYRWDASAVADGRYWLYARISDATTTRVVYAPAPLLIRRSGVLFAPEGWETSEAGDGVDVLVQLADAPTAQVIVPLATSDTNEAMVDPAELVFTPANWQQPQRIRLTGVDDTRVDGDQAFELVWGDVESDDPGYHGLGGRVAGFTNIDDDVAALLVEIEGGAIVTSEDGGSTAMSVRLASQPSADVRIEFDTSEPAEAVIAPAFLVFTPDDWDVAQTLIVSGVDDDIVDGDVDFLVRVTAILSTDPNYAAAAHPQWPGVNLDDESAQILVDPADGIVVDERGGQATLTIRLNTAPTAAVRIGVTVSDPSEAGLSTNELQLDAGNWNDGVELIVTGVYDGVVDGDQPFSLQFAAAVSDDTRFHGLQLAPVDGITLDWNPAGLQVGAQAMGPWLPGTLRSVALAPVFAKVPLVFPLWVSDDAEPHAVRVMHVDRERMDLMLVRRDGSTAAASTGRLAFIAIEPGEHRLPDGRRVRAAAIDTVVDAEWVEASFERAFDAPPAMLVQVQSAENRDPRGVPAWLGPRVAGTATHAVRLGLGGGADLPLAERIGYLAVDADVQGAIPAGAAPVDFEFRRVRHAEPAGEGRCTAVVHSTARAEAPLAFASLLSVQTGADAVARVCALARSHAAIAVDPLSPSMATANDRDEVIGLLAFSREFATTLRDDHVGIDIGGLFGRRTYADGMGTAFSVRLTQAPTAPVSVAVDADIVSGLATSTRRIDFTADDWNQPRWVRVDVDAGQPLHDPIRADVTVRVISADDLRYRDADPAVVGIDLRPAGAWQRIVDNRDEGFASVGNWQTASDAPGYHGADYLWHAANGESPDSVVVDNSDAGFETIGDWTRSTSGSGFIGADYLLRSPGDPADAIAFDDTVAARVGPWTFTRSNGGGGNYGGSLHVAPGGTGNATATWPLAAVAPGEYRIYAHWTTGNRRASDAPYVVHHADGTDTVRVNQRSNGGSWNLLGTWTIDGQSKVVLSNAANGEVVADGIKLVPTASTANSAIWTVFPRVSGVHEVYARWVSHPHRASNAPLRIEHADGVESTTVNQRTGGGVWVSLGRFRFVAGQPARITLTDQADGVVVADAVRIVPEQARPNSARWQLATETAGPVSLWATWPAASSHASNAAFAGELFGSSQRGAFDQRQGGARWHPLATGIAVPEAPLAVSVTDRADGRVVADAVRVLDHAVFGPEGSLIVDDAQSTMPPGWTYVPSALAWGGGFVAADSGQSEPFEWRLPLNEPDSYRLYVRWASVEDAASDARFVVTHIDGADTVEVDQRGQAARWVLLGIYQLGANSTVRIAGSETGAVNVDALRLEPARYPVPVE